VKNRAFPEFVLFRSNSLARATLQVPPRFVLEPEHSAKVVQSSPGMRHASSVALAVSTR
jgi:hypothetical protein